MNGTRKGHASWFAALLAAAALAAGCSLDYQAAELEEKVAEGIPDTAATGVVHKIHKNGRLSLELEAARVETYNAKKTTILSGAWFVEYDDKGEPATEGSGRRAVFHSDTENAEISGDVTVRSDSEKAMITAESLSWDNKARKLVAPTDEVVVIRKDDGSYISGKGFTSDFRSREVRFTGPVEGRYVWEEKEE